MAKRKDDASFSFSKKPAKKEPPPEPAAETPPDASADPFATPSDTPADPFASPDTSSSDPFASADTSSSDPFASTDTPAADPFATPDASADPFASTETPAEPAAETPAEETPAEESPAEEEPAEKVPQIKEHKQFRILILADLSGRTNRGIANPADIRSRKVRTVDTDSLDKTLAAIKPEIQLPVDEKSIIPLSFKAMEDFRPDSLLQQIAAFQGMLDLRGKLKDSKKFKEAAATVRKLTGAGGGAAKKPAKPAAAKPGAPADSDFERLLNQPVAPKNAGQINADALIANLVSGYVVPDADPEQAKMVGLVEDALSAGLRAVLRHPAFQSLEGAWRGIEFLTSRLNTDEDLKLAVLDISKDELYADLSGPPTIDKTGMYQILVEQPRSAGGVPFSLVVGDYDFDQTPQNIALLAKIATLMHEASVPFIAAATPKVAGFPSFAKFPDSGRWQPPTDIAMWEKIRGHKFADHLGLAAPRFLLRLPYGPKTDAIDTYPFDEMPADKGPVTEGYLWGNGAFAVAYAVGQGFLDAGGWEFEPGTDVADLPCHMAMVDGDKEMTPCAQGWLSDRIGDVLHQLGLIPLLSVKNAAAVKIAGLHSIAKGGKPLAAAWAAA